MLPMSFRGQSSHGHVTPAFKAPDDLPKTVTRTLTQGSSPMSMDFHPVKQSHLLVGTNVGDIELWEVGSRERLVHKTFKVWDLSKCSMPLQAALAKEPVVSVNRVIWSPDGSLFGVAYSRHIVQLYSYHGGEDMRQHLEIDAHVGGVNDISFLIRNMQLCVVTCGDDKTIKVWNAATGVERYTLEGHETPVYSICPHYMETFQLIISTALDGKIKAWLYDNMGSRASHDAPGGWCTRMAYSADGKRLFSCGTSKDGESYITEWNDTDGAVKRSYKGLHKPSHGVVQFDTAKNRYLAAGDDISVKFWDMNNFELLTAIDGDGGLQASPRIRFNKEGSLLAVSGNENVIKVMANSDGLRLLQTFDNVSSDSSKMENQILMQQQQKLMLDQMMLLHQLQNQMSDTTALYAESNGAATAKAKQNQMIQKLIKNQSMLQQQFRMLMQQQQQNPMRLLQQQRQFLNPMMTQEQLKYQTMMMIQQHQKQLSKKQEEEMTQLMESLKM